MRPESVRARTPPAERDIQCCVPDDSGAECEDRTPVAVRRRRRGEPGTGTCAPDADGTVPPPSGNATVLVKCEVRSDRSKISVDGNDLATGSYQAVADLRRQRGDCSRAPDERRRGLFDFDSDDGDIAAGATAIASDFIQGTPPQVTGAIVTLSGGIVAQATVDCVVE